MNKNLIETLTGAFVLIVAAWFLLFFMENNTGVSVSKNNYNLIAKFEQADGITVGTPVRIAGVKVGVITKQELDLNTYFAVVTISINNDVKVPTDSIAKIVSEGLVGGKYLAVAPGANDEMLKPGEEIQYTQSSISLETLIGKMVFSGDKKASSDNTSAQPTASAVAPSTPTTNSVDTVSAATSNNHEEKK